MPENCIIGCLMADNSLIRECDLMPDDFQDQNLKLVLTEIRSMAMTRTPFDAVTLADRLKEKTKRSWLERLVSIQRNTPATQNFTAYHDLVKQASRKRRAIAIGEQLAKDADTDSALRALMALSEVQREHNTKIIDAVKIAIERIEDMQQGVSPGVMSGLADLDKRLGGFHRSDLIVIAGRPSLGKTALALNLANRSGTPIGFISAEQSHEQLGQRFIALNATVSVHRMRNGQMERDDWQKITACLDAIEKKDVYINDKPAISLEDIQRTARYYVYHYGIKMLIIDYLQKISIDAISENMRERNSAVVVGSKNLARELDIPVIALAQVKREVELRPDKRPYMSDIAESGVVEREADQVITLYRDEVYNPDSADAGVLELIVCKNRHGPTGTIKSTWIPEYMRVENYIGRDYAERF